MLIILYIGIQSQHPSTSVAGTLYIAWLSVVVEYTMNIVVC